MTTTLEGGASLSAAEKKHNLGEELVAIETRLGKIAVEEAKAAENDDRDLMRAISIERSDLHERKYQIGLALFGPPGGEHLRMGLDYQCHVDERRKLVEKKSAAQKNVQVHAQKVRDARTKIREAEKALHDAEEQFKRLHATDPGLYAACKALNLHKNKYPEIHVEGED